jgi:hypothetical protein
VVVGSNPAVPTKLLIIITGFCWAGKFPAPKIHVSVLIGYRVNSPHGIFAFLTLTQLSLLEPSVLLFESLLLSPAKRLRASVWAASIY